jgi:hypothetical protein
MTAVAATNRPFCGYSANARAWAAEGGHRRQRTTAGDGRIHAAPQRSSLPHAHANAHTKPRAAAGGLRIEREELAAAAHCSGALRIVCMRVPAPCMPMITSAQRKNDAVCTNVKSP